MHVCPFNAEVIYLRWKLEPYGVGCSMSCSELIASFFGLDHENLLAVVIVAVVIFYATASRRPSRRCNRCREINREQAVYCAQCGTRLPKR